MASWGPRTGGHGLQLTGQISDLAYNSEATGGRAFCVGGRAGWIGLVVAVGALALAPALATGARAGIADALDETLDRVGEHLSFAARDGAWRVRLSGRLDLEAYHTPEPVADLVFTADDGLFNPRLTLYLDAQASARWYAFAQVRVDRGYDPADDPLELRAEEYAVRFTVLTAPDRRLVVQAGRFASVFGAWGRRHGAWEHAFVTPPLTHESLTGLWGGKPPANVAQLLEWAHLEPLGDGAAVALDERLRLPIMWGASYTTGAALAGTWDRLDYALEVKNGALSSPAWEWDDLDGFDEAPTWSGRLGWRPNAAWDVGVSASRGPYLASDATDLPWRWRREDYRQTVLGHDVGFAWRHLQLWGEVLAARFELPGRGDAETIAYYLEARYKFSPRWVGAVRWNQHLYGRIPDGAGGQVRWGRDVWRVDVAPGFRVSAHSQVKLQWSLRHEAPAPRATDLTQAWVVQWSARF